MNVNPEKFSLHAKNIKIKLIYLGIGSCHFHNTFNMLPADTWFFSFDAFIAFFTLCDIMVEIEGNTYKGNAANIATLTELMILAHPRPDSYKDALATVAISMTNIYIRLISFFIPMENQRIVQLIFLLLNDLNRKQYHLLPKQTHIYFGQLNLGVNTQAEYYNNIKRMINKINNLTFQELFTKLPKILESHELAKPKAIHVIAHESRVNPQVEFLCEESNIDGWRGSLLYLLKEYENSSIFKIELTKQSILYFNKWFVEYFSDQQLKDYIENKNAKLFQSYAMSLEFQRENIRALLNFKSKILMQMKASDSTYDEIEREIIQIRVKLNEVDEKYKKLHLKNLTDEKFILNLTYPQKLLKFIPNMNEKEMSDYYRLLIKNVFLRGQFYNQEKEHIKTMLREHLFKKFCEKDTFYSKFGPRV